MVNLEDNLDAEPSALLDGKRLVLEGTQGTGLGEFNDDVGPSLHLQGEGFDDAFSGVVGVADGFTCIQA